MYIEKFFFILIFSGLLYANSSSTTDKNIFTGSFNFYTEACKTEKILKTSHKVCIPLHIIGRYKISFLLHEPVIQSNAKYYIQGMFHNSYISIDGKNYEKTDLPKKEWKELFVSDIKIMAELTGNYWIIIDPGGIIKEGVKTFNAPLSPEWDQFVLYDFYGVRTSKLLGMPINLKYLDKQKTINIFKTYVKNNTKNIFYSFDATADFYAGSLVRYILDKEKKKPTEVKKDTKNTDDNKSSESSADSISFDDVFGEDKQQKKSLKNSKSKVTNNQEDISSSFDSIFGEDEIDNSDTTTAKQNSPVRASLLMLIDISGSMDKEHRLEKAKEAAIESIKTATKNQTEVAILAFSGDCSSPIASKVNFTLDENKLIDFVRSLSAGGGTPLGNALKRANYFMKKNKNPSSKMQMIMLLADGDGNCGNVDQVLEALRENKIVFRHETIGLGVESNSRAASDLRQIAQKTGGSYHHAQSSRELKPIFMEALDTMEILDMIGKFGNN